MKEDKITFYCYSIILSMIFIIYTVIQFSYLDGWVGENLTSIDNTYHIFNFLSYIPLIFAVYILVALLYVIFRDVFKKIVVWRGCI